MKRHSSNWINVVLALPVLAGMAAPVYGQQCTSTSPLAPIQVSFADLSAFRSPGANWSLASAVRANREQPQHLEAVPGTGVLVNQPGPGRLTNLFTTWEHGDIELEVEVLMPRGSNSGIYLQGRYEVQLLDSWRVAEPTSADMGGIYERWDESRPAGQQGYEGVPPRINAARAPGIWQCLRIEFQAPRFDEQGNKIQNARFVRVMLNGSVIHEDVEVTGPTRAAAFEDEAPTGPLMFQGDHGPVAFRNLRYKPFTGARVELAGLEYSTARGEFADLAEATAALAGRGPEGTADAINPAVANAPDQFAVRYQGTLIAPASGTYAFDVDLAWIGGDPHFDGVVVGGASLVIDGREVLVNDGLVRTADGQIELEAGEHPFTFVFFKNRPWNNVRTVSLWAEGPGVQRHPLHQTAAGPMRGPPPLLVEPEAEPVVLRGFMLHNGVPRTHAIAVGDGSGIHYSYDLASGAILHLWRGPFVDASAMWRGRGESQLAQPMGSVISLSGEPTLARLRLASNDWPATIEESHEFRPLGYTLDAAGRPSFRYRLGAAEVEDRIRPLEDGSGLSRELLIRGGRDLYVQLGVADRIIQLDDGTYLVGDNGYYVVPRGDTRPFIRAMEGRLDLIVPVPTTDDETRVAYDILW